MGICWLVGSARVTRQCCGCLLDNLLRCLLRLETGTGVGTERTGSDCSGRRQALSSVCSGRRQAQGGAESTGRKQGCLLCKETSGRLSLLKGDESRVRCGSPGHATNVNWSIACTGMPFIALLRSLSSRALCKCTCAIGDIHTRKSWYLAQELIQC